MNSFRGIVYDSRHGNNPTVLPEHRSYLGPQPISSGSAFFTGSGPAICLSEQHNGPSDVASLVAVGDLRIDNTAELNQLLDTEAGLSDIELLLATYRRFGDECANHIVGEYAFAIWDRQQGSLFLCRDRLGTKGLYYVALETGIAFSTRVIDLSSLQSEGAVLDLQSALAFITLKPIPKNRTFLEGVRRLPPAESLSYSDGRISSNCYWKLPRRNKPSKLGYCEAKDQFLAIFDEAIRCRIKDRGHIGCELSGGLDSSSVLGSVTAIRGSTSVTSYTLDFGDSDCDEKKFSREVREALQVSGREIVVSDSETSSRDYLYRYYRRFPDWPLTKMFSPTVAIADLASRENIDLVLTGQGGDHLLEGNMYYLWDYFRTLQWRKLTKLFVKLPYRLAHFKRFVLRPMLSSLVPKQAQPFIQSLTGRTLFLYEQEHSVVQRKEFRYLSKWFSAGAIEDEFQAYWSDACTEHQEFSAGTRFSHPFFDSRLVEFVYDLPPEYLCDGKTKRILRDALKGRVPESVLSRHDKAEFTSVIRKQLLANFSQGFHVPAILSDHPELGPHLDIVSSLSHRSNELDGEDLERAWRQINLIFWFKTNSVKLPTQPSGRQEPCKTAN